MFVAESWSISEPAAHLRAALKAALESESKTKVVLVAHSQGTIIAAHVLYLLWEDVDNQREKLTEEHMAKLEIYQFANAGQVMKTRAKTDAAGHPVTFPYIESICNQQDNVGMLGANAPELAKKEWGISIAGKVIHPSTVLWGHMINAHYLKPFSDGDYGASHLHGYMGGGGWAPRPQAKPAPMATIPLDRQD